MGGFFLVFKQPNASVEEIESSNKAPLSIFEKKGLRPSDRFVRECFIAWHFQKIAIREKFSIEMPNGDFAFCSGTLIYARRSGILALRALYSDFIQDVSFERKISGNFCVVIYHNERLILVTDYCGYYPVYWNTGTGLVSTSFLAASSTTKSHQPSFQELFEYILMGFFVGPETVLEDVTILDGRYLWQLLPEIARVKREPFYEPLPRGIDFRNAVDRFADDLSVYFDDMAVAFDRSIGAGLSGGYDTRLMLALTRRIGVEPDLYVYGDADSKDSRIALLIGKGEGLTVEHIDKRDFPKIHSEEFLEELDRQYYFFDALKPLGLFDDGSDLTTRLDRATRGSLQLNGAGGEIFREVWNLGNRSVDIVEFLRNRYDIGKYGFFRNGFSTCEFFENFAEKIKRMLDIRSNRLSRRQAEMLFPFLRNMLAAPNNSSNNQISYSLLPFMEPRFVLPSLDIPLAWKFNGRFNAALIKSVDYRLARYQSSYGINFSDPIPGSYKFTRLIERHIPLCIRLLKRSVVRRWPEWPYYLEAEYLNEVKALETGLVNEVIDFAKIRDPEILSRALSAQLFLARL